MIFLKYQRKRILKRKPNYKIIATFFVAIILVIVTITSLVRGSFSSNVTGTLKQPLYTFGGGINHIKRTPAKFFSDLTNFMKNADMVERLERENRELKKDLLKMQKEKNTQVSLLELQKSLNYYKIDDKNNLIAATTVAKNDGLYYESFVISAGKNAGVVKDSVVINEKGVIGIVYEVDKRYSKVITLIDSKTSVGFSLNNNPNDKGVISHNISLPEKLKSSSKEFLVGYLFNSDADVIQGDSISTSGLGIYPGGLPIGEVDEVRYDKNKSIKYIKIRPFVDYSMIDDVIVIPPRNLR